MKKISFLNFKNIIKSVNNFFFGAILHEIPRTKAYSIKASIGFQKIGGGRVDPKNLPGYAPAQNRGFDCTPIASALPKTQLPELK